MDPAQVTPQRPVPPGVGTGQENKDAKYHFISGLESSPFHRLPLGEHNHKAALLSGPQRVPVKSVHHNGLMEQPALRSAQRGSGNFMKPTESSRLASTPVRLQSKHQSPGRTRPAYVAVTPVAESDSANINHFVSPTACHTGHQVHSNPLQTPTRTQSAGRSRPSNALTGSPAAMHVITPSTAEAVRPSVAHAPQAPLPGSSGKKRVALASPPGRVTVASVGAKATNASPKRSVSAGRAGPSTPSYLQPTASSQMLFSPEAAARVQHQHQHGGLAAAEHSPQVNRTTQGAGSAGRPASAPRARPQSLSAHMQARSEQLLAEVAGATADRNPVAVAASPSGQERPRQQESTAMRSPQPTPSSAVPKVPSPAPAAASKPKGSSTPVHTKAARSADVLSANKAAKLAALAAAKQAQSLVHAQPSPAGLTGAARYAQPTHSSAAATAALLTSNPKPTPKNRGAAARDRAAAVPARPGAAVVGAGAGIAARHLQSAPPAGGDAFVTPTSTPQRATKLHKRPPTAPTASSAAAATATAGRRREGEAKPAERQITKPVVTERGTRTIERTPTGAVATGKSKIPVMAGKVPAGAQRGGSKMAPVAAATQRQVSAATHGDSIMQILEGHDGSFAQYTGYVPASEQPGVSGVEDLSRVRRSYSFGSELSCVEAGPDELVSIGASIDFSANNTFDSDRSQLSLHDASTTHVAAAPAVGDTAVASEALRTAQPTQALAAVSLRAPNLSNRGSTARGAATAGSAKAGGLQRLQLQLEEGLENVSIVEAPTSFSPSNLSNINMSAFSQDVVTPLSGAMESRVEKTVQPIPQQPVTPGTTRWAEDYTAFFPPEISLVSGSHSAGLSYVEESSAEVSGGGARDDSGSCDSPGGQQLQGLGSMQEASGVSGPDSASFAPSPLPQNVHPSQHHHPVQHALRPSTASTVASASDALNQAMMASSSYSLSVSSMPSFVQGMAPLSLMHPGRLVRQCSDQSTCNISAITPAADGTTFNSSSGDIPDLSLHQPSQPQSRSQSRSQSRQQVGASSDSLVSNLLDRAMIASYASYSYEQEASGDYLTSESTTSVSPFLRGNMTARSDSGFIFTPVVRANPALPAHFAVRTMFSPPPPPQIETSLPLSGDNTLSASQQFDSSVNAIFAATHAEVAASVESLPPPPPPPLESVPEITAAPSSDGVPHSAAEMIKQRLLERCLQPFDALRSGPPTPAQDSTAPIDRVETATAAAADVVEVAELSPLPQVPRLTSFGSVHSMSMLCSTDSADLALCRFGAGTGLETAVPASSTNNAEGAQVDSQAYSEDDASAAESSEKGDYCGDAVDEEEECYEVGEEEVNLVDDFDSQSPEEDTVNIGDAYSDCDEEQAEADYSVAVDDAEVVQEVDLSEEEELSDDDADPSELQFVNASIQSINTSRLAASACNSSVSVSHSSSNYSYSSSVDELRGVNPQLKSASWVQDNYPQDSISSDSVGVGAGVGAGAASIASSGASILHGTDTGRGLPPSNFQRRLATSHGPAVLSAAREEAYRSSRHHAISGHYTDYAGPPEESCPDPVAGQLLAMPACLLASKRSHRTMQSVFVPVGAGPGDLGSEDPSMEEKRAHRL